MSQDTETVSTPTAAPMPADVEEDGYVTIRGLEETHLVIGDTLGRPISKGTAGSLELVGHLVGHDRRYEQALHVWLSEQGLVRLRRAIDDVLKRRRARLRKRAQKRG